MRPTKTRNANVNFQPPANWDQELDGPCGNLHVRVDLHGKRGIFEHVSTWKPSADDLALLNRGAVIELMICATSQPPVGMCVVEPVDGFVESDQVSLDSKPAITINEHAHGDDAHGA